MPPLGFITGAAECADYVKSIIYRLMWTIACDAMHQEPVRVQFIKIGSGDGIGGGDGVNVRMQFSQPEQDKHRKILAHATLRPS